MDEQIVRKFLKEGVLLSPDTLAKITEKNADLILEQAKKENQMIFSLAEQTEEQSSFEVRNLQKKQKLTAQDFTHYYNIRFEGIRNILVKKIDAPVSVANAKKSLSDISTIGMVREQTQRGFIIEDTTGEAEVISKNEEALPDDTIGIRGTVKEEKIFAEEIVWPDISMSHKHNKPDLKITLSDKKKEGGEVTPNPESEHKNGEFLITPEAVYGFDKKRTAFHSPGWITIKKDSLTTTVLVYNPGKPVTAKEAFTWLKKCHLSPQKTQIRGAEDPFLIETIPDLFWIVAPEKSEFWKESYKGVIIVSFDGKTPTEVNLATGEVTFKE